MIFTVVRTSSTFWSSLVYFCSTQSGFMDKNNNLLFRDLKEVSQLKTKEYSFSCCAFLRFIFMPVESSYEKLLFWKMNAGETRIHQVDCRGRIMAKVLLVLIKLLCF